jgi:hypothetical protein
MALWPGARRGACELGGIGVRGTTMSRGGFYRRISFVFSICLVTVVKEGGHVRSAKRRREFLPARRGAYRVDARTGSGEVLHLGWWTR